MKLRPEEITAILRERIEQYDVETDLAEVGTVLQLGDGIARVYGLENAGSLEMLEFEHGVTGLAFNLEEDDVGVALFGDWEQVGEGEVGTLDDWSQAHATALQELQPEFDARWRGFSVTEQKAMRAVIAGDGSPYRTFVLARLALEKPTAQAAIERLSASAEIELDNGKHRVIDPLFAQWIALVDSGEPEAG